MTAIALVVGSQRIVAAEEYGIGPWYVLAEPVSFRHASERERTDNGF